jgi:tetratricopeptide (TPR) repeat protein
MPVPVKAVFEDGSRQIKLTNRLFRVNNLEFESRSKLKEAILDPDNKLALLETPSEATPEELSDIISLLPWTGAGEEALKAYEKAISLKLDHVRSWFKLGLILFDGGYYKESFKAFEKLIELNPPQLTHFASLVWMGHLQDLFGNREEALKYYNEALKRDTGGTMRHDQWGIKIGRQWIEERLKSPFKWGKK